MRPKLLLLAGLLGAAGVFLPAPAAHACITLWVEPIGSVCDPDPCAGAQRAYDRLQVESPHLFPPMDLPCP